MSVTHLYGVGNLNVQLHSYKPATSRPIIAATDKNYNKTYSVIMQKYSCETIEGGSNESGKVLVELLGGDIRPSAILKPCALRRGSGSLDLLKAHTLYQNDSFEVFIHKQSAAWIAEMVEKVLDAECAGEVVIGNPGLRCLVRRSGELLAVTALDDTSADTAPANEGSTCRQAFEATAIGLAIVVANGDLTALNSAFYELTTLSAQQDIKAYEYLGCVDDQDRRVAKESFYEALSSGGSTNWLARMGHGHPGPGWKYWVASMMNLLPGEPRSYVLALSDITHLKLSEESHRQAAEMALQIRRRQEEFMDVYSHELRGPFCSVMNSAEWILQAVDGTVKPLDPEDVKLGASTILMCTQNQLRIINDVLTLSKLDSDRTSMSVAPVDAQIHHCISDTLRIFQYEFRIKDIKAIFEVEDSYAGSAATSWLKCDPSRFTQILINLITNAIKFTGSKCGKRAITITLGACTQRPLHCGAVTFPPDDIADSGSNGDEMIAGDGWGYGELVYLHLRVKDTGIGISTEWQQANRLFNRFQQASNRNAAHGGSGLGLYICRELCELQGGRIWVWSEEGRGSEFSFYIKARRTAPPPDAYSYPFKKLEVINDPTVKPTPTRKEQFGTGFVPEHVCTPKRIPLSRGKSAPTIGQLATGATTTLQALKAHKFAPKDSPHYRILVVEDNTVNQQTLCRLFRINGFITHTANNGQEGLAFIQKSEFGRNGGEKVDVVLMDNEMPVMSGNTATRKIREEEAQGTLSRHVPILGTSGHARREQGKFGLLFVIMFLLTCWYGLVSEMIEAGMDDTITKPYANSAMLAKVNQLVERFGTAGAGKMSGREPTRPCTTASRLCSSP